MANGQYSVEFHIDDWATPGLPGMTQERRAVTSAKIATVKNGTRVVKYYNAGEPLEGRIQ